MKAVQDPEWLTLAECAAWLRITPRKLSLFSKGLRPVVPGRWFNQRVVRFHKPTVVAHLTDPNRLLAVTRGRQTRR